jgi:uncharacterized protein (TIGR02246 family)
MATPIARSRIGVALLCLLVWLVGCSAPPEVSTLGDEAAIAEFNRQYLAAINTGNVDALARLTTSGHVMIASGGAPLLGKQALVDAMTAAFERVKFDESWMPVETVVDGDMAYQRGTFVVIATPKAGGEPSRTTGNFLRIYARQPDGEWRMVRDMFNSAAAPEQSGSNP